ncbi:uncharacterized protein K441DRAFT_662504 [Cenococcum geophilum 1.58]|uniref:uncharacterized protein n=1 Tax=Cenococcum geophilum 1.58 TaxID=794803 RepID=UPI00358E0EEB|nr:hypothetical protein K441DRAFT_662504 [Cenococcum geophilum 1.58]
MPGRSENTPFLADNDHSDNYDETESHVTKTSPANAHFKRPIKILTIFISLFSISIFGLLIASYVLIQVGPFQYTYSSPDRVRDLAICLFVNFILSAPTIFLQIPITINLAVHIAMSIVIFVFSGEIFWNGWPGTNFCRRWNNYPDYKPLPETLECRQARDVVRIMMGISAGFGIIIGLQLLTMLLLRLIAITRTRFWEGKKYGNFEGSGWQPTGFTVQFTLGVLKQETPGAGVSKKAKAVDTSSGGEEGRLIET